MAYGYYAKITIDNTKVPGDLTNFPMLVSGTYDGTASEPDIRTTANGGNVENTASGGVSGSLTVPADLVFSPNTDGSSPYSFEIQEYDAATGKIIAWVKVPSVSSSADTEFYMVYGDATVVASQEDVNGTWDSDYVAVWHMVESADGTAGEYLDSTSNGNDGQGGGGTAGKIPTRTNGKIGYGQDFDGGDDIIEVPHSATLDDGANGPFTVEAWLDPDDSGYAFQALAFKNGTDSPYRYGTSLNRVDASNYRLAAYGGTWQYSNSNYAFGSFRHVAFAYSNPNVNFYVDGSADGSGGYGPADTTGSMRIGDWSSSAYYIEGIVDELRISSVARSADYLVASFNSQSAPSSFYSMGNEDSGSTTTVRLTWTDNSEGEDGFSIERDDDGGGFAVVHVTAAGVETYDNTVSEGHTYTYRVRAMSAALGDSEYSNEATVIV